MPRQSRDRVIGERRWRAVKEAGMETMCGVACWDCGGLRSRLWGQGGRFEVVASGFSRVHRYPYVPLVLFAFGKWRPY